MPCPPLSIPRAKGGCSQCPPGSRPDISRSHCIPSPVEWGGARERDRRAVAAAALAGLASAILSAAALWRHRNTPAVKAASRELCALQLCAGAACQVIFSFTHTCFYFALLCGWKTETHIYFDINDIITK